MVDALRATVRLSQGSTSGTGFFVTLEDSENNDDKDPSRCLLVTAAHVFNDFSGDTCKAVLRVLQEDGTYVRRDLDIAIRKEKKPLWVRHPDLDVAVIAAELPDGVDVQPLAYRQIADETFAKDRKVRVGQAVFVPCFPAQLEANAAGWPVLRTGSIASHPLTPVDSAKTIFIDYSHFGGDSGSPVFVRIDDEPIVIGVVFAMQRQTDKTTSPFEERVMHTPLGLAITVQAPLVRDTIELWRQQSNKK
ncbi:MAG: trypsin-like peptidase domain-containing protein [Planctomycetales bacterium]|nr:trypsin-like peptidase domain-containing protein [Planctomycetales bacterium]